MTLKHGINKNVSLIDPNQVNVNPHIKNSIPKYEDMFIHVSLVAKRRGRSVVFTGGGIGGSVENLNSISVNLLGCNQKDGDAYQNKFTTNYYDGSTGEYSTDESFGIENIKITTNSSYIPRVEIRFIDIRGLSFFSNEHSKYRMLFDFPPPIFELEVKGYYGGTLKYLLHLTSYTTSFDDTTANHIIDAKFVALTYAPLTDIPFRYVVNVGYMNSGQTTYNPSPEYPPNDTFELISKLKTLYSSINQSVKGGEANKSKVKSENKLEDITNTLSYINEIPSRHESNSDIKFYLFENGIEQVENSISQHENLTNIIQTITKADHSLDMDEFKKYRIYVGFEVQPNLLEISSSKPISPTETSSNHNEIDLKTKKKTLSEVEKNLNDYIKTHGFSEIKTHKIVKETEYSARRNEFIGNGKVSYLCLDLKDLLNDLLNQRASAIKNIEEQNKEISNLVDKMVKTKLGMEPTIRNIFNIILNDVDTFFEKIREVGRSASAPENKGDRDRIFGNTVKDGYNGIVYPFPLVINNENNAEVRVAPIRQSETGNYIPEIDFVIDFIRSFSGQLQAKKLYYIKEELGSEGTNIWIPLSPIDSSLGVSAEISLNSPYFYFANPIQVKVGNTLEREMYDTIAKRFMAISQNSQRFVFENEDSNFNKKYKNPFIELFARGEAVNLLSSVVNTQSSDIVTKLSRLDISTLITELSKYKLEQDDCINLNIVQETNIDYYINRQSDKFIGFKIINEDVYFRQDPDEGDDLYGKFIKETKKSFWDYFKPLTGKDYIRHYGFSNDNLIYHIDKPSSVHSKLTDFLDSKSISTLNEFDGHYLITRFLNPTNMENPIGGSSYGFSVTNRRVNENIKTNLDFNFNERVGPNLTAGGHIIHHWATSLKIGMFRELLKTTTNSDLYMLIVLSNFGSTMGFYNRGSLEYTNSRFTRPGGENNLNLGLFSKSGIVELPNFVLAYMGLISHMIENQELYNNFIYFNGNSITGTDKKFSNCSQYILADIGDVSNCLSVSDRKTLIDYYLKFKENHYDSIRASINNLLGEYNNIYINNIDVNFFKYLSPTGERGSTYFDNIIEPLIKRVNLLVYGSNTFSFRKIVDDTNYISFGEYNSRYGDNVTMFFNKFLEIVGNGIKQKRTQVEEEAIDVRKITEDNDIINQTYYSFKNIHDKWVSGTTDIKYPFIGGKNLRDCFVFVDRAMNDIGDTMINGDVLVDLFNDSNASVFTVISQLLSNNGFEFFPLQNFMSHTDGTWGDSFKINANPVPISNSFFVCMYIGGVSSYLNNPASQIPNDGIVDLSQESLFDFRTEKKINQGFSYSNVYAFSVKYAEQNQSMFKDIKISSKEFPETNESIQILSRLAKEDKDVQPIPKGQNLYSIYENRAYGVKIESLGNVMIQPTQYFQLENIQLYNGAYLILSVEHDIKPNHMLTTFEGTKILKYPVPRVLSPVAFTEFSNIGVYGFSNKTAGEITAITMNVAATYNNEIGYESIFDKKIIGE